MSSVSKLSNVSKVSKVLSKMSKVSICYTSNSSQIKVSNISKWSSRHNIDAARKVL